MERRVPKIGGTHNRLERNVLKVLAAHSWGELALRGHTFLLSRLIFVPGDDPTSPRGRGAFLAPHGSPWGFVPTRVDKCPWTACAGQEGHVCRDSVEGQCAGTVRRDRRCANGVGGRRRGSEGRDSLQRTNQTARKLICSHLGSSILVRPIRLFAMSSSRDRSQADGQRDSSGSNFRTIVCCISSVILEG